MSKLEVDAIEPQSGTTITIGASGDTVNLVGTLKSNGSPLPGDISEVVAGTGLSGGGTTGAVTINIEAAQPTITSLGTITSFRSTGIDDNSNALAMTIDSNENVGIGANPNNYAGYKNLTLNGTSGGIFDFEVNGTRTGSLLGLAGETRLASITNIPLTFQVNNAEKMRLTTTGLGIGTSNPSQKLEVSGTNNIIQDNKTSTATGIAGIQLKGSDANSYLKLFHLGPSFGGTTFGGVTGNNQSLIEAQSVSSLAFTTQGGTPDIIFAPARTARMTIKNGGNVGIGTAAPGTGLQVDQDWVSNYGSINVSHSTNSLGGLGIRCNNAFKAALIYKGGSTGALLDLGTYAAEPITFRTNNSEKMRINSNGNIGIGETAPVGKLHVKSADSGTTLNTAAGQLFLENSGNAGMTIGSGASSLGLIYFADSGDGNVGRLEYSHSENSMRFWTNDTERMRITSDGDFLVGKTSQSSNIAGCDLTPEGTVVAARDAGTCAVFSRLTNDGVIVSLRQANVQEGTISVSGTTVSYNGFTGTHWSRFTDNSTPTILRGTVLETLDEMCYWYNLEFDISITTQDDDGNDVTNTHTEIVPHVLLDSQSDGDTVTYNHEGTDYQATIVKEGDVKHMMSKVSDNSDAKNVYGVFAAYDLDGEGYNDFYVASVGSYVVRIKSGETLAKGDLLQSNGDGTAKVQSDDNIKSSSFAKVLSTTIIETYEDGSYLVPCSLMC